MVIHRAVFAGLAVLALFLVLGPTAPATLISYTAEGDTTFAADKLVKADGSQDGTFINQTTVNEYPKFGSYAYGFDGVSPYDTIDFGIANQSLGTAFTLAAFVKQSDNSLTRLFSSYPGGGPTSTSLLFDFENNYNAGALAANELRFILDGTVVYGNVATDPGYTDSYYHYAVTYNDGAVNIYFNGNNVGSGTIGSGAYTLTGDLSFGEDTAGTNNENIKGSADDILILDYALTGPEVAYLNQVGSFVFLMPEPSTALLLLLGGGVMWRARRR